MVTRFIQDHFLGAVLLLAVMSVILGIVGIHLAAFILAIWHIFEFAYGLGGVFIG